MKIAFMGTPEFAVTVLEGLLNTKHEVGLVATQPDKAKNRGKKIQYTPVKEKALEHNIKVLQPEKVRGNEEFLEELTSLWLLRTGRFCRRKSWNFRNTAV